MERTRSGHKTSRRHERVIVEQRRSRKNDNQASAFATCLLLWLCAPALADSGRVVGVHDGDTITVLSDRQQTKIRLHGIDSPESKQPFGSKAKAFTSSLAFGKPVEFDVVGKDRYGRTVAIIILPDGRNLNHEIVRAGFAWWFRRYAAHDLILQRLEAEARAVGRGLWAEKDAVPPWEWRRDRRH